MYPTKSRSNFWYLLPTIFGIIGGVVAFFILRRDDPKKARNCILIGIVMMIAGIILDITVLSQIPDITEGIKINS